MAIHIKLQVNNVSNRTLELLGKDENVYQTVLDPVYNVDPKPLKKLGLVIVEPSRYLIYKLVEAKHV